MKRKILSLTVLLILFMLMNVFPSYAKDPLPSWNDGEAKRAIIQFVKDVTHKGGPKYVPPEDRIATFDNDGTLWCEMPVIQVLYMGEALKEMAEKRPELKEKPFYQAVMKGNLEYFEQSLETKKELLELLALTHSGMTLEDFRASVAKFFKTARHPKYNALLKETTYLPMVELLKYLRANGFKTFICSGGGIYFMRVITDEIYGIPPEQVIGTAGKLKFEDVDGKISLMRLPSLLTNNDKEGKPTGIALHIGKKPIFAAGNVRSGGDVAMLRYCQSNDYPSLQLMIDHDDDERESAYSEPDNASLNAADKFKWIVVSMKKDWKKIFSFGK